MLSDSIFETSNGEKLAEFLRQRRRRKITPNVFRKPQEGKENRYSFNLEFESQSSEDDEPRIRESALPVQNQSHDKSHDNTPKAKQKKDLPQNASVSKEAKVILENIFAKPARPVRRSLYKNSKTSFLPAASSTPLCDHRCNKQSVERNPNAENSTQRTEDTSLLPMLTSQSNSNFDQNKKGTDSSSRHRNKANVTRSQNGSTVKDKEKTNDVVDELRNSDLRIKRINNVSKSSMQILHDCITSDEDPIESTVVQPAPEPETTEKNYQNDRETRSSVAKKNSSVSAMRSSSIAVPEGVELKNTTNIVQKVKNQRKTKGRKKPSKDSLKEEYLELTERLSQNRFPPRKSESRRKLYTKNHSGEDEHEENFTKVNNGSKNSTKPINGLKNPKQAKNDSTVNNKTRLSVRTELLDEDLTPPITKTKIVNNISKNLKTINNNSLSREELSFGCGSPIPIFELIDVNKTLSPLPENESSGGENLQLEKKGKEKKNKNIKEKKKKQIEKVTNSNEVGNVEGCRRSNRKRRYPRAYWTNEDIETDGIAIFNPIVRTKAKEISIVNKTKKKKENNLKYTKKQKTCDDIPEPSTSKESHSPHISADNIAISTKKRREKSSRKAQSVASHSTKPVPKANVSQGTQTEADNGKSKLYPSWLNKFLEPNVSEIPVELLDTDEQTIGRCNALAFEEIDTVVYAYYAGSDDVDCGYMKFEEKSNKAAVSCSTSMQLLIMFGCLEIIVNNLRHILNAGDFILVPKGQIYSIENKSGNVALIFFSRR